MPRSQMLMAVAQATFIGTLTILTGDYLLAKAAFAFDPDIEPPTDITYTRKDYYLKVTPKNIVRLALINSLRYYWYIGLEHILPSRPRPKFDAAHNRSASRDNELEEEKIIAEWIAQGRIRRSTISCCNILTKVFLDITIGNVMWCALSELLERILRAKTPDPFFHDFVFDTAAAAGVYLFSTMPPVSLLAFIVAPAHQRIVFEDGVYLVFTVFFALFLGKLGPWLMSLDGFREAYLNATQAIKNGTVSNVTLHTIEEL